MTFWYVIKINFETLKLCDKLAVGMFKDVEYMLKYRLESHTFQGYVRRINKSLNWNG